MAFVVALIVSLLVATLMLQHYFRRSAKSLQSAVNPWNRVYEQTRKVLTDPSYPEPVREFAYLIAMTAGCGCYVGSIIWQMLGEAVGLVRLTPAPGPKSNQLSAALHRLSPQQRAEIDKLIVAAIVHDSFMHPLRGWFLRRRVKNLSVVPAKAKKMPPAEIRKAQQTIVRIVETRTRRGPLNRSFASATAAHIPDADAPRFPKFTK